MYTRERVSSSASHRVKTIQEGEPSDVGGPKRETPAANDWGFE